MLVEKEILSVDEARALYAPSDATHDFDHVLRVARMAVHIAEQEGADVGVVHVAALLHDVPVDSIADTDIDGARSMRKEHHLAAAQAALTLLHQRGLGTDATERIVHCIEAHRYRDGTIQPETLEAQCVYDADKLDSMGAIGIARVFAYAGSHSSRLWTEPVASMSSRANAPDGEEYTPVHEYYYKLDKLLDCLHTQTARRIGRERHTFMKQFFERLDAEMLADA